MYKKHKQGILLAATKDSAFTIGTLLINIQKIMPKQIDIFYIVHDGFLNDDQNIMQTIAQNGSDGGGVIVKFIFFDKKIFLQKLQKFQTIDLKDSFFLSRYTHMSYACFEPLKLLKECKNILYLDFDILILKNLKELFKIRKSIAVNLGLKKIKEYNNQSPYKEKNIIRTGIISYNDKLENPEECYNFIYKISSQQLQNINDQYAFSLMIHHFNIKFATLSSQKYVGLVHYRSNRNASIIHAYGESNRFWNNELCNRIWYQWQKYYDEWTSLGGSTYKQGFKYKTTYSQELIRFHLAYKLGWIIVHNHHFPRILILPFLLAKCALWHKIEAKIYTKEKLHKTWLNLPHISEYEDYKEGLKVYESKPYRLGTCFLNFCKSGNFFVFLRQAIEIKNSKNQENVI